MFAGRRFRAGARFIFRQLRKSERTTDDLSTERSDNGDDAAGGLAQSANRPGHGRQILKRKLTDSVPGSELFGIKSMIFST